MIKSVIFDMYETLITHYDSPLYFGAQIAKDAGISVEQFQKLWRPTEYGRSVGAYTFEEILEQIMKECGCYTEKKHQLIVQKRIACKEEAFNHLHEQLLTVLDELKQNGIKIGLISNCFSEEAMVIRNSVLFPYFDAVCLSYEEKIQKPDPEIFERCLTKLQLSPEECLYIGDGGSNELEAATNVGMHVAQAVWYLKDGTMQPAKRKKEFVNIETPLAVLNYITK